MDEILIVVLDVSGSFAENGKIEVLRSLRLSTASFVEKFDADAEFFIWRDEVRAFQSPRDVVASGKASIEALIDFISDCDDGSKFLILSDCMWTSDEAAAIRAAFRKKNAVAAAVAIGADASRAKNYCVSTLGGTWTATDIGAAIQTVLNCTGGETS